MKTRILIASGVLLVVLALAGCGGSSKSSSTGGSGQSSVLVGAGSTLVAPLVAQWSGDYAKKNGVTVTYGAIGSGGGIAQITARTVDFGGSDAPLTPDQATDCKNCLQVPWALGATLPAVNLEGAPEQLKVSGPVLADIYLGKITTWNDPAIAKLNPGASLPSTKITPVFRSDGSGDTYAFSDYLSKVSPEWRSTKGVSTQVNFSVGIGGKGNDGVTSVLQKTNGAIAYVGIGHVVANSLDYALVQNAAGKFPVPGPESIAAAAKAIDKIPADNTVSITNPPASAPDAYPISTFTYAIVPQDTGKAQALKDFLTYAIGPGQEFAPKFQFAQLSDRVLAADRETIGKIGSP